MLNKSIDILNNIKDPTKLNDLYKAALLVYPELKKYQKEGYYFSGSGSSFFKVLDETSYLLSSKNNRDRLLSSLQHTRKGQLKNLSNTTD